MNYGLRTDYLRTRARARDLSPSTCHFLCLSANGLGMVLAEKGTLDHAKDVFARVREVSAEVLGDVWINLAHVYLAQNKHNEVSSIVSVSIEEGMAFRMLKVRCVSKPARDRCWSLATHVPRQSELPRSVITESTCICRSRERSKLTMRTKDGLGRAGPRGALSLSRNARARGSYSLSQRA